MKAVDKIAIKFKDGHFLLAIISIAFILSAVIIFAVDQIKGQISYSYIIAAIACIYVSANFVFIDVISQKITKNKKAFIIGCALIVVEIAVFVLTILFIRKYAVLQNELEVLYKEYASLSEITEATKPIYDAYLIKSRAMEGFYWQMGIMFMLWWVSPFVMLFIKVPENTQQKADTELQDEQTENL